MKNVLQCSNSVTMEIPNVELKPNFIFSNIYMILLLFPPICVHPTPPNHVSASNVCNERHSKHEENHFSIISSWFGILLL